MNKLKNNNNTKENVYSAVITAEPTHEFTQFINILMSRGLGYS